MFDFETHALVTRLQGVPQVVLQGQLLPGPKSSRHGTDRSHLPSTAKLTAGHMETDSVGPHQMNYVALRRVLKDHSLSHRVAPLRNQNLNIDSICKQQSMTCTFAFCFNHLSKEKLSSLAHLLSEIQRAAQLSRQAPKGYKDTMI